MLLKRLTLLLFVFFAAAAEARLRPEPGQFGFEGEWIYFNPSFDYPYTLLAGSFNQETVDETTTQTTNATNLANSFDYQSGFRVGGAYAFCECCLDLHVRYTWLLLESSRFIKGYAAMAPLVLSSSLQGLIATVARQKNTFDYHDVDAYFGKTLCCGSCLDLALLGGIRYAQVELKYETTYGSINDSSRKSTNFDKQTSCFWGVGPEMGFDVAYSFGCGFSFTGRAETGLLISRMEGKKFARSVMEKLTRIETTVTDINLDPTWRLVPLYDLRLGLAYYFCCSWFSLSIEGGYEALSYVRALPIFEQGRNEIVILEEYSNADLHGPYINVAITF